MQSHAGTYTNISLRVCFDVLIAAIEAMLYIQSETKTNTIDYDKCTGKY